jgi:hypothetical protein
MSIDHGDYLKRFELGELGPEHFDHRGHLLMAWIHLCHYGQNEATARVCRGVKELAAKFGAPEKYNHTLTIAFMLIIKQRMFGEAVGDFHHFLVANPDLVQDARAVVLQHYSRERLDSPKARSEWLVPDLKPFDQMG